MFYRPEPRLNTIMYRVVYHTLIPGNSLTEDDVTTIKHTRKELERVIHATSSGRKSTYIVLDSTK